MKKDLLNNNEKEQFREMGSRIDRAMQKKGIKSEKELNDIIRAKRGNCPDRTVYHKIKWPPGGADHTYYNLSSEYLYVIADALDVTTDYLLGKEA